MRDHCVLSGLVWGVGRVEAKSDREGGNEPRSFRSENKFGIVEFQYTRVALANNRGAFHALLREARGRTTG
jgi:hypothetical protein